MAPPPKRRRQLRSVAEAAREAKRWRELDQGTSSTAEGEVRTSHPRKDKASGSLYELARQQEDAPESESEVDDPTFDLDASIKSDGEHMAESFCEEWVAHLDFGNKASLGLFMTFQLQSHLGMG